MAIYHVRLLTTAFVTGSVEVALPLPDGPSPTQAELVAALMKAANERLGEVEWSYDGLDNDEAAILSFSRVDGPKEVTP